MSRSLALMWSVGGLVLLVVAAVPSPPEMSSGAVAVIGALAMGVGAMVAAVGSRMPAWGYPTLVLIGTGVVTSLIVAGGGGVASVAFTVFYVWVVVYAMLFFSGTVAALQLAGVVVGYATAHAVVGSTLTPLVPIVFGGTLGITALVVGRLSRVRAEARLDPLTRLVNRRGADTFLEHAMQRAVEHDEPLTVAALDIDHFKRVNDDAGHQEGDRLLRAAAACWKSQLRTGDLLARQGGDEFLVVLPACTPDEARDVVERLRASTPSGATCSAGLAAWRPGDSISMLLGRADRALYEAKRAGRDRMFAEFGLDAASWPSATTPHDAG